MRLYITGGTGLVGSNIIKLAQERYRAEVIASLYGPPPEGKVNYKLDPLDIGDHQAIYTSIRKYKPDVVIHSAALLDQQMMNRQRKFAWTIMVEGTRTFAYACREVGARLVFVSSDWVFDGREPLVDEDSPPHPVNFYGIMKMASERELSVMDGLNYAVGRLAGVYGVNYAIPSMTRLEQGVGFGDLATYYVARLTKGQPVDVWMTGINDAAHPTLATDGADLLLQLAQNDATGIFHCFCPESISRLDLAKRVAEVFEADHSLIHQVPTDPKVLAEHENIRIPFRCNASTAKSAQVLGRAGLNVVEGLKAFKPEWEAFQQSHTELK